MEPQCYKAGSIKKILFIILSVTVLFLLLPIGVHAEMIDMDEIYPCYECQCKNKDCPDLPIEMTECYACLYGNWDTELKEYTKRICERNNIPCEYVLAIIWNESRFQSDAFSFYGDTENYGLMQINSVAFDYLEEEIGLDCLSDLYNPKVNIYAGVTLLKYHREFTNSDRDMILRYQVGEGNFDYMKSVGQNSIPALERVLTKAAQFKEVI